jgi:hypothetical protein
MHKWYVKEQKGIFEIALKKADFLDIQLSDGYLTNNNIIDSVIQLSDD